MRWMLTAVVVMAALFGSLSATIAEELTGCNFEQAGDTKIALVIGNASYSHRSNSIDFRVESAKQDAYRIASILCHTDGFQYVDHIVDASDGDSIRAALARFKSRRVSLHPKVALIYYSGHGYANGGISYLVPIGIDLDDPAITDQAIVSNSVGMNEVFDALGPRDDSVARIVVLDACRDPAIQGAESSAVPPVSVTDTGNFLIAFSAPEGRTVDREIDGDSAFTSVLLRVISQRNLSVQLVHIQAQIMVEQLLAEQQGQVVATSAPIYGSLNNWYYYGGVDRPDLNKNFDSQIGSAWNAMHNSVPANATISVSTEGVSAADALSRARDALSKTRTMESVNENGDKEELKVQTPNFTLAAQFLKRASLLGSPAATRRLGDLYREGYGVKKSLAKACELYDSVAALGDLVASEGQNRFERAVATERRGDCFRDLRHDNNRAIEQYHISYARGFHEALAGQAWMDLCNPVASQPGQCLPKDDEHGHALSEFEQAETEGSPDAAGWIAWIYFSSRGAPPELTRAQRWARGIDALQRGADRGDITAIEYLARIYQVGYNQPDFLFPKNLQRARVLFERAIRSSDAWFIRQYDLLHD